MTSKAAQIRELIAMGKTAKEIAKALGVTSSYIADVRANPPSGKPKTGIAWTNREMTIAAMMRDDDGATFRQIGDALGRSPKSVENFFDRRRAQKLGRVKRAARHREEAAERSVQLSDQQESAFAAAMTRSGRNYAGVTVQERAAA